MLYSDMVNIAMFLLFWLLRNITTKHNYYDYLIYFTFMHNWYIVNLDLGAKVNSQQCALHLSLSGFARFASN